MRAPTPHEVEVAARIGSRRGLRHVPGCEPADVATVALAALCADQQAHLAVTDHLRRYGPVARSGGRPRLALERVARSLDADAPGRLRPYEVHPDPSVPTPYEVVEAADTLDVCRRALARHARRAHLVLVLDSLAAGHTGAETAEDLGVSLRSAETYRSAVRAALRPLLLAA